MRLSILVLSAVLLAACGQAGPLYLPDEQADPPPEPSPPVTVTPTGEAAPEAGDADARKREEQESPQRPSQ